MTLGGGGGVAGAGADAGVTAAVGIGVTTAGSGGAGAAANSAGAGLGAATIEGAGGWAFFGRARAGVRGGGGWGRGCGGGAGGFAGAGGAMRSTNIGAAVSTASRTSRTCSSPQTAARCTPSTPITITRCCTRVRPSRRISRRSNGADVDFDGCADVDETGATQLGAEANEGRSDDIDRERSRVPERPTVSLGATLEPLH